MAIPTRTSRPGTFFVTTTTHDRRRLFQATKNAELFLETLQHYRVLGHYKLHAFVVMPDHVHLILTPQGITLERAVGLIKGGFSHRLASSFPVWQRGFTDHRIRDAGDMEARRTYLHLNPVRGKLVEAAELYPYSSVYRAEKLTSGAEAPSLSEPLRHG
jgi:putative transposase